MELSESMFSLIAVTTIDLHRAIINKGKTDLDTMSISLGISKEKLGLCFDILYESDLIENTRDGKRVVKNVDIEEYSLRLRIQSAIARIKSRKRRGVKKKRKSRLRYKGEIIGKKQYKALLFLKEKPGSTIYDIGKKMGYRFGTISFKATRVMERLISRGFIDTVETSSGLTGYRIAQ